MIEYTVIETEGLYYPDDAVCLTESTDELNAWRCKKVLEGFYPDAEFVVIPCHKY